MEFEVSITREDYKRYQKAAVREASPPIFRIIPAALWMGVFLFFIGFFVNLKQENPNPIYGYALVFFGGAVLGCLLLMVYIMIVTESLGPSENGVVIGTHRFIVDDQGIRESIRSSETFIRWEGVQQVIEDKDYFFVFIDRFQAHVIPRNQVDAEALVEIFQRLCPKYVIVEVD